MDGGVGEFRGDVELSEVVGQGFGGDPGAVGFDFEGEGRVVSEEGLGECEEVSVLEEWFAAGDDDAGAVEGKDALGGVGRRDFEGLLSF